MVKAAIDPQAIEAITRPLGLKKCIEQLQELHEWLGNLSLDDKNDLCALNAAIEALKLLRG